MARSAQAMYEEAFFSLLGKLHNHYGLDSDALAGGCMMQVFQIREEKRSQIPAVTL